MSSGAGRLQSLRGPNGQLGAASARMVRRPLRPDWQHPGVGRHRHVAFPPHRLQVFDVQLGGRRLMHRRALVARSRRRRHLNRGLFQYSDRLAGR